MTDTRFTPGPWHYEASFIHHVCHRGTVCDATTICNLEKGGDNEANAHLIAAAPELYEATDPFDELYTHHAADAPEWKDSDRVTVQLSIGDLRAIKAARAKARGEA